MFRKILEQTTGKKNFVFVGEAGSGKSEIAINFARQLKATAKKEVHFFDMDMTKPLYRSRDVRDIMENMDLIVHYEEQFADAPTMVGGVQACLRDEDCYVVMDVGGDYIGARSVGAYAPRLNADNTVVYCVLNAFRPWSDHIDRIDRTLGEILGVSHIQLGQVRMISNPNLGAATTAQDFLEGYERMQKLIAPYKSIDFACAKEELCEKITEMCPVPILPLHLYLTYEWLTVD